MYIFDTKVADPMFQEIYLANTLLNSRGWFQIFYKIDLLLTYQNREFKSFQVNQKLFLPVNNEIF